MAEQRLVGDLFHGKTVGRAPDHGHQSRHNQNAARRKARHAQQRGHDERGKRPQHVDFAVGEVDQADDAVHHRIAQGDQRVDAAAGQAAEKNFEKIVKIHRRHPDDGALSGLGPSGRQTPRGCMRVHCPPHGGKSKIRRKAPATGSGTRSPSSVRSERAATRSDPKEPGRGPAPRAGPSCRPYTLRSTDRL